MAEVIPMVMGAFFSILGTLLVASIHKASKSQEQNTHAIIELKVELGNMKDTLREFARLKPDIDNAHQKIRELEFSLKEHQIRSQ